MNQCIHGIDLLRWMLGDEVESVTAVTAQQNHPYIEAEDLGMAIVRFRNGAYGTIEGTVNCYKNDLEERLCLFGEQGTVCAGGIATNQIDVWQLANGEDEKAVCINYSQLSHDVYGHGHTLLYKDMLDSITHKRAPLVDGAAGRRALELVIAIYAASKSGQTVHLPLAGGGTMDFSRRF